MDWDLVVIFGFVLALIALRGWFSLRRSQPAGLSAPDQAALDRALDQARRLEERIDSLERILDDDMPGWRRKLAS